MYKRLKLYLIKPSKYDDEGYVIRHWKGVLPSNTLACLLGLAEDVKNRKSLGADLKWQIEPIDETVERVNVKKIIRESRRKNTKTIIGLVGVQSNQFPRAFDLGLAFRNAGIDVLIGGFHVSGVTATLPEPPLEILALREAGITIIAGEVEGRLEIILRDSINNQLHPIYNFLNTPPDISQAPMPIIPKKLSNRYAIRNLATLDCGRGCPFQCSFCTVINVQGRKMRFRSVDSIIQMIRHNFYENKISCYFFTDDNLARHQHWESLFDSLIDLREKERMNISFSMQVDTQSYRIPNFIEKASRAGCTQAFIGVESVNEENLVAASKTQNKTANFKQLIETYLKAGITTHLGYIIGFPFDTQESIESNVRFLKSEIRSEETSFFMLTPLPGSEDHKHLVSRKVPLDADLNNFDSFHETFRHSRMNPRAWTQLYENTWRNFYSLENIKEILRNTPRDLYWGVFMNLIWYKNSLQVENGHPMLHGFFRLKNRKERRSIFPLESRWAYGKRRALEIWKTLTGWAKLAVEMEEAWLATRHRGVLEERVLLELKHLHSKTTGWRNLRVSELQNIYRQAAMVLEKSQKRILTQRIRIPSRFSLWLKKWNVFSNQLTFSRLPMISFWKETAKYIEQGKVYKLKLHRIIFTSLQEIILLTRFVLSLLKQIVGTFSTEMR